MNSCDCGRPISRYMHGKCMACRFKERTTKTRIKIDPSRLPAPPLPRTREKRIGEVVPLKDVMGMIGVWDSPTMQEARKRGQENSAGKRGARPVVWTPEKDEELIRLRAEGKSYADIVTIMGRSLSAVEHRLIKLRKAGKYKADWRRK